jgi:hypothetical protein
MLSIGCFFTQKFLVIFLAMKCQKSFIHTGPVMQIANHDMYILISEQNYRKKLTNLWDTLLLLFENPEILPVIV